VKWFQCSNELLEQKIKSAKCSQISSSMSPQHHSGNNNNNNTARHFVIVCVVAIFAILGILIAYNSGASTEEAQNMMVQRRINVVSRRLVACNNEVFQIKSGFAAKFDARKSSLDDTLSAVKTENDLYTEQSKTMDSKLAECLTELGLERKKKTGTPGLNATDEMLSLTYSIKSVEASIQSINATRMVERQKILRIIEAYAKENDQLTAQLQKLEDEKINSTLNV
jgi:hypothetical protein